MILYLFAYCAGALTIASPCILPVLPFVFARADRPFLSHGLPMLLGLALTFVLVATLVSLGGGLIVQANAVGRAVALIVLGLFGLSLLLPEWAARGLQPLVRLGDQLSHKQGSSLVLGVATGLIWAPCAGPILGLVLTGAALQGVHWATILALLAYALGAVTSLALALLVGGRVFVAMKRALGWGEWLRRILGIAVLVSVLAVALGWDRGVFTGFSTKSTNALEQSLRDKLTPIDLPIESLLPSLDGAVTWLNSPPLTLEALKGKVVLIDFWTYSCINCLRTLPYIEAWAEKYKDQGLVVIGVHAPEFAFEKSLPNIQRAVEDLHIHYPVAVDNDYKIWRAFHNEYWPAHYFVDRQGRIRHHHFGEGEYDQSEKILQTLLQEPKNTPLVSLEAKDLSDIQSPETYIGYERAENFASAPALVQDHDQDYRATPLSLNAWALSGRWNVGAEHATLVTPGGGIAFRFHARDLHLVLSPGGAGRPVRFRVTIDGQAPKDAHGQDINADGQGTVLTDRLYNLIQQKGAVVDHDFEIQFLDAGVQAFSFTFG